MQVFEEVLQPVQEQLLEEELAAVRQHRPAVVKLLQSLGVSGSSSWADLEERVVAKAKKVDPEVLHVLFDEYHGTLKSKEV